VIDPWWAGIPPVHAEVPCGGSQHRLSWVQGELVAPDHPDGRDDDREGPFTCRDYLDTWANHRDDLQVLTLGRRNAEPERPPMFEFRYVGPPRPQTWHRGLTPEGVPADLLYLVNLSPALLDRLALTAAATWIRRIDDRSPYVDHLLPRLHAAVYGRATSAARRWLNEPRLPVTLEVVDDPGAARLVRSEDGLMLALTIDWLVDVWAKELATIWGRFCIAAARGADGRWDLTTVAIDGGPPLTMSIDPPPDAASRG
jgi:hypothetical protein